MLGLLRRPLPQHSGADSSGLPPAMTKWESIVAAPALMESLERFTMPQQAVHRETDAGNRDRLTELQSRAAILVCGLATPPGGVIV